ncbi:MAG: alkaline phosphatase family protein [Deltaproteobacteria bacterium]|nr:alkaline phosphatase family protein [Deltaproteobacteria bacterium]
MSRSLRPPPSLAAFVLALAALLGASSAHAAPRVVIVGVDGASWSVIDRLLAQGKLPNLAALMKRGVHANLATVEPVISPVVWTSIATGQPTAVHGIGDFFGDAREIAAPTIFERLAVQGLRVGTYEWLVTWPPRPLPGGFVIPDWLRRDGAISPSDAFARAGVGDYRYSNAGITTRDGFHRTSFRELAARPSRWNALARAFELDAGAVSFYAIDALSHRFWGDSFPAQFEVGSAPPPEARYARAIEDAYVGFDRALGEIVAALPAECAVIVASDHGFQASPEWQRVWSLRLRKALAAEALHEGPNTFEMGEFAVVAARVVPGDFAQQDALLEKLVALLEGATTEAGAPLFSVWRLDGIQRPEGHERGFSDRLAQWAFRQVARFTRGFEFDQPAHAWIVAMPNGDALDGAWPNGRVRIGGKLHDARELIFGDGFSGTHDPVAVFAAAGGALRHDARRGELSVLDIAPLYAYLARAQIPDDLPGKLATHWLEPSALAQHPPRFVKAGTLKRLPPPAAPAIPDEELLERLRAMGYVE